MSKPVSHLMDVYSVWIHLARTKSEWKSLGKKYSWKSKGLSSAGLTERFEDPDTGTNHYRVFINKEQLDRFELIEICAHEASHVAGFLFTQIGEEHDGSSETFAHLVGWVTAWLWNGCQE